MYNHIPYSNGSQPRHSDKDPESMGVELMEIVIQGAGADSGLPISLSSGDELDAEELDVKELDAEELDAEELYAEDTVADVFPEDNPSTSAAEAQALFDYIMMDPNRRREYKRVIAGEFCVIGVMIAGSLVFFEGNAVHAEDATSWKVIAAWDTLGVLSVAFSAMSDGNLGADKARAILSPVSDQETAFLDSEFLGRVIDGQLIGTNGKGSVVLALVGGGLAAAPLTALRYGQFQGSEKGPMSVAEQIILTQITNWIMMFISVSDALSSQPSELTYEKKDKDDKVKSKSDDIEMGNLVEELDFTLYPADKAKFSRIIEVMRARANSNQSMLPQLAAAGIRTWQVLVGSVLSKATKPMSFADYAAVKNGLIVAIIGLIGYTSAVARPDKALVAMLFDLIDHLSDDVDSVGEEDLVDEISEKIVIAWLTVAMIAPYSKLLVGGIASVASLVPSTARALTLDSLNTLIGWMTGTALLHAENTTELLSQIPVHHISPRITAMIVAILAPLGLGTVGTNAFNTAASTPPFIKELTFGFLQPAPGGWMSKLAGTCAAATSYSFNTVYTIKWLLFSVLPRVLRAYGSGVEKEQATFLLDAQEYITTFLKAPEGKLIELLSLLDEEVLDSILEEVNAAPPSWAFWQSKQPDVTKEWLNDVIPKIQQQRQVIERAKVVKADDNVSQSSRRSCWSYGEDIDQAYAQLSTEDLSDDSREDEEDIFGALDQDRQPASSWCSRIPFFGGYFAQSESLISRPESRCCFTIM